MSEEYKEFKAKQRKLYKSTRWRKLRMLMIAKYNYRCSKCGLVVQPNKLIAHHIINLNASNISDDDIVYSSDNIEIMCLDCHNKEDHDYKNDTKKSRINNRKYVFDAEGNFSIKE